VPCRAVVDEVEVDGDLPGSGLPLISVTARSASGLVMVMTGPVGGPMLVPLDSKNSALGVKVVAAVPASMFRSTV
jgi:hypothetical protein